MGRNEEALENLAYLRRERTDSPTVLHEMAEIDTAIIEEREARKGLGLKEAFFGKGNFIRFLIAFFIFFFQQWAGQNSVKYVGMSLEVVSILIFRIAITHRRYLPR